MLQTPRKCQYFWSLIGSKTYGLLRNLVSPLSLADKEYKDFVDTLKAYFKPKPIVIASTFIAVHKQQASPTPSIWLNSVGSRPIVSSKNTSMRPWGTALFVAYEKKRCNVSFSPRSTSHWPKPKNSPWVWKRQRRMLNLWRLQSRQLTKSQPSHATDAARVTTTRKTVVLKRQNATTMENMAT